MTRHSPVRGVKSRPELAVSGRGAQRMLPCGNRIKASRVGPGRRAMPSHKFKIGDTVMLRPAVSRNVPGGIYEVTKQLPHNGREFEYRIKSAAEEHERVALESELTEP
jgi:hypothetical protein